MLRVGAAVAPDAPVSLSIGQAFYPPDGSNAEQLLATADRRMYGVKTSHYAAIAERHAGLRAARSAP